MEFVVVGVGVVVEGVVVEEGNHWGFVVVVEGIVVEEDNH